MVATPPIQSPLTKEDELHWLALRLIPGLGTRKANQLLERLRTPQAIFRASRSELEASGLSGSVAQTIASGCTFDDAVDQQQKMLEAGRNDRKLCELRTQPASPDRGLGVSAVTMPTPVQPEGQGWRTSAPSFAARAPGPLQSCREMFYT